MKPYRISIFGHLVDGLDTIADSAQMVTHGLICGFEKLPHVSIVGKSHANRDYYGHSIQPCDFIVVHQLFTGQPQPGKEFLFDWDFMRSRCRAILLVLEASSRSVGWNFTFQPTGVGNETVVGIPCLKSAMIRVPKDDRAVLLDHGWPEYEARGLCLSKRLLAALRPLSNEFALSQLERLYIQGAPWAPSFPPPWLQGIPVMPFVNYLDVTKHFGTFIVTHAESWGHSVIDMAARGIRVVSPRGLLSPTIRAAVRPLEFDSDAELIAALRTPINHADWDSRINSFVSFDDVCLAIDRNIQGWI